MRWLARPRVRSKVATVRRPVHAHDGRRRRARSGDALGFRRSSCLRASSLEGAEQPLALLPRRRGIPRRGRTSAPPLRHRSQQVHSGKFGAVGSAACACYSDYMVTATWPPAPPYRRHHGQAAVSRSCSDLRGVFLRQARTPIVRPSRGSAAFSSVTDGSAPPVATM
jgi:hypothetical protein